jgi:hypothetical protein
MRTLSAPLALIAAACLAVAGVAPVMAQDVEPEAPTTEQNAASAPGSPEESITFVDTEGVPRGTITVREMADPFTDFDPARPPPEGQRYLQLIVTFEAAEDQSFGADPAGVVLLDQDGYLHTPSWVPRPAGAMPPDVQSQTLSPYDRVSGSITYQVPADASVVRILYRSESTRLITVSVPGHDGAPAVGEPRVVRGADRTELGTATVRALADPYLDFEPTRPPAEGARYVLLTMVFEAAPDAALWADPSGLFVQDDTGRLHYPSHVPRPAGELMQDLDRQPLSPEDRVSGMVGYQVPLGVAIERVLYSPEWNRFLSLAEVEAAD